MDEEGSRRGSGGLGRALALEARLSLASAVGEPGCLGELGALPDHSGKRIS